MKYDENLVNVNIFLEETGDVFPKIREKFNNGELFVGYYVVNYLDEKHVPMIIVDARYENREIDDIEFDEIYRRVFSEAEHSNLIYNMED